jgi:hypothetical protein
MRTAEHSSDGRKGLKTAGVIGGTALTVAVGWAFGKAVNAIMDETRSGDDYNRYFPEENGLDDPFYVYTSLQLDKTAAGHLVEQGGKV